jgi:hypothetical protein
MPVQDDRDGRGCAFVCGEIDQERSPLCQSMILNSFTTGTPVMRSSVTCHQQLIQAAVVKAQCIFVRVPHREQAVVRLRSTLARRESRRLYSVPLMKQDRSVSRVIV